MESAQHDDEAWRDKTQHDRLELILLQQDRFFFVLMLDYMKEI